MSPIRKRPVGIVLLAFAFLWIGVGGTILFPILWLNGGSNGLWHSDLAELIHSDSWVKTICRAVDAVWYVIYIFYAVIGFGLWKLKNWARKCVLGICVIGLLAALVIGPTFKMSVSMSISIFGMAATELGWMGWYLLRPRVQNAFGAWKQYPPDGEWIQPPILSGRERLGASILFTAIFVVVFLIPLAFTAANLK